MKIRLQRCKNHRGVLCFTLHMSNYFGSRFSTIFTCDFYPRKRLLRIGCQQHSIDSPFWEKSADDVEEQFGFLWREFVECGGVEKVCSAVLKALESPK